MEIIPQHSIGLLNCFWYSLIYGLATIIITLLIPKDKRKRIHTFPKFSGKLEKALIGLTLIIFSRGLMIYSIFIPIKLFTPYFYIGTIIYYIGMSLSVYSMYYFSKAELSKPVTSGIYRLSRNPMQVMSLIMQLGIGIASANWIFIIITIFTGILMFPSFRAQERFCIDKYGEEYINYLKKTPRYILF